MDALLSRWRHLLAPGLLVLVATAQLVLVRTHHLTPWKGGGFGMFSTFDSPSARTLRLILLTSEGEAVVAIPSLHVPQKRLLNLPNTRLLADLAERTARLPWRIYSAEEVMAARRSLPGEIRRQLARAPASEAIAFPADRNIPGAEGHTPEIGGVRAEAWGWHYDAEARRLRAVVLNAVTIP